MGASPNYNEAVKICNGSLHSPMITKMGENVFLGGNQMVRDSGVRKLINYKKYYISLVKNK